MKIKTNKLTDAALNWAVGIAYRGSQWCTDPEIGLYHRDYLSGSRHVVIALDYYFMDDWGLTLYSPSTDWAQGGPIIERERIDVLYEHDLRWIAVPQKGIESYGPTPLIAAMRCFVASKLGDEVEVPEELTK
jgi:hypothetical protein